MLKQWTLLLTDSGLKSEREKYTLLDIIEKVGGLMVILSSALSFFFSIYNYKMHNIKILEEYEKH